MGNSSSTVRTLLHQAYGRLEVPNAAAAVALAFRSGWVDGKTPVPAREPTPVTLTPAEVAAAERRDAGFELTPFMRAYLGELDAWLSTGDLVRRRGMRLALAGMRNH